MQSSRNKHILKRPKNQQDGSNRSRSNKNSRNYGGESSSPAPSVNSKYRAKNPHSTHHAQNVYNNITSQYDPQNYGQHHQDQYYRNDPYHQQRRNDDYQQQNYYPEDDVQNDQRRRAGHRPRKVREKSKFSKNIKKHIIFKNFNFFLNFLGGKLQNPDNPVRPHRNSTNKNIRRLASNRHSPVTLLTSRCQRKLDISKFSGAKFKSRRT